MDEWKLGKFSFTSEEEYHKAIKEAKTIKLLSEKYDINNTDHAKAILEKYKPETVIGRGFCNKLRMICEKEENERILKEIDYEVKRQERNKSNINYQHGENALNDEDERPLGRINKERDKISEKNNRYNRNINTKQDSKPIKREGNFNVKSDKKGITIDKDLYEYDEISVITFKSSAGNRVNILMSLNDGSSEDISIPKKSIAYIAMCKNAYDNHVSIKFIGLPNLINKNGTINTSLFIRTMIPFSEVFGMLILAIIFGFGLAFFALMLSFWKFADGVLAFVFAGTIFKLIVSLNSHKPGTAILLGVISFVLAFGSVLLVLYLVVTPLLEMDGLIMGFGISYSIIVFGIALVTDLWAKLNQLANAFIENEK